MSDIDKKDTGRYVMLLSPEEKPILAYYYYNHDAQCWGYGFNTADGAGFLPDSDVKKSTVVKPVDVTPKDDKPAEIVFAFTTVVAKYLKDQDVDFDPKELNALAVSFIFHNFGSDPIRPTFLDNFVIDGLTPNIVQ